MRQNDTRNFLLDVPDVFIRCPNGGHLRFVLPYGQNHMEVEIPKPESNVDWRRYVTSEPSWGMHLRNTLPAGRTQVTFTAASPVSRNTISCSLTITILDQEAPKVHDCPNDQEIILNEGENARVVYWKEPYFTDNVEVTHVYKSKVILSVYN